MADTSGSLLGVPRSGYSEPAPATSHPCHVVHVALVRAPPTAHRTINPPNAFASAWSRCKYSVGRTTHAYHSSLACSITLALPVGIQYINFRMLMCCPCVSSALAFSRDRLSLWHLSSSQL